MMRKAELDDVISDRMGVPSVSEAALKARFLVGSPVRQDPEILKLFLTSLSRLEGDPDFVLVDDNANDEEGGRVSTELLRAFTKGGTGKRACWRDDTRASVYIRTEHTHTWTDDLLWRVASHKNHLLDLAREGGYDYVLLVDSDVLVPPDMLLRLQAADKDVIANIFWTQWQPGTLEMPQVWSEDTYTFTPGLIEELRVPGVYEVGGLGACTLISKRALQKRISFDRVHNVSFWGEDRHFCIRAVALGLSLFVDTRAPAFHVYRGSDIEAGRAYLERTQSVESTITKVVYPT